MLETIKKCGPQLRDVEASYSRAGTAVLSANSSLQVVRASESSKQEEAGELYLDKTCLEKHCGPKALHGSRTYIILYRKARRIVTA